MSRIGVFAIIATLSLGASVQADTVFKIIGPNGEVTYSSTPPTDGRRATTVRMDVPAPEATTAAPAAKSDTKVPAPKAHKSDSADGGPAKTPLETLTSVFKSMKPTTTPEAAKQSADAADIGVPIFFYGANCEACSRAKKFFDTEKIKIRAIDVDTADGRRARNEVGSGRTVPLLVVNGQLVTGFTREKYIAALSAR